MNIYLHKKPKRINSFSVTLFLMAVALGYAGYFYIPLWWPVFQLGGIMRGICNDAYRTTDDEVLMAKLVKDAQRVRLPGLTRENFEFTRVPYTAEELVEAKGAKPELRGKRCELSFYYEREVTWPLIGHQSVFTFEKSVASDLSFVNWDKKEQECRCVSLPGRRGDTSAW